MTNNSIKIEINPDEILKTIKESGDIVFNPEAEDSILRLLEVKSDLDQAIDQVKEAIEKQALAYDKNFASLKGSKLKVNYSAAGAKYKATGEARRHSKDLWTKKVSWSINSKAVDKYMKQHSNLPSGIVAVERKKTIRISEVNNG